MRKILIIAKREYLERVRTKSFILMTLLIPAFMLGVSVLPTLMVERGTSQAKHLVIVASDAKTADLLRQQINELSHKQRPNAEMPQGTRKNNLRQIGTLLVDVDTNTSESERAALTEQVKQKQLDGAIFATDDALAAKKVTYMTRDVASLITTSEIEDSLNEAIRHDLLRSKGMSDEEIGKALQPVSLEVKSPLGMGNPRVLMFTVISMVMILYVTVFMYGINVMRAILEEKTSRIMEVMLSTARSSEMMAGKILGVAGVGLTQIGVWAAASLAFLPLASGALADMGAARNVLSTEVLVFFAIFFLLGFALYSTVCAAVGAVVNSEQEAQQLQFLVALPLIGAVFIMFNVLEDPGSSTAVWASLFPLTAPLIMFLRVALQSPPWWQIGLSIALMMATTIGLVWICARIYRVGILMYGKRPTLPEILKWIRYA